MGDVSEIVIAKSIKGIAAYSHKNNRLYINEKLTDESFLNEMLKDGYFVAENKLDVLWHEMFHKKHWDFGEERAVVKPSPMESSLPERSAPGASRKACASLSKGYTNRRYGRFSKNSFFMFISARSDL